MIVGRPLYGAVGTGARVQVSGNRDQGTPVRFYVYRGAYRGSDRSRDSTEPMPVEGERAD